MRQGLTITALALCLLLGLPSSPAGATTISLGGSFGVGHLPMADWRDFWTPLVSNYDADRVGLYGEIYGRVAFGNRHGLSLSVERISKSAFDDSRVAGRPKWDFVAVPINLTYEYGLRGWTTGTTPFFGIGVGLYRSQVEAGASGAPPPPSRVEWGYGIHGTIGQRLALTRSLAVSGKLRGRWADGMYFADNLIADVEFTGVDATVGMEWLF